MGDTESIGCKVTDKPHEGRLLGCNAGEDRGFWDDFDFIPCGDGKARRVEPGTFPLAHGVPKRVAQIRAYGNACPTSSRQFIRSYIGEERILDRTSICCPSLICASFIVGVIFFCVFKVLDLHRLSVS